MNKNKDIQKTFSNAEKAKSEQKVASSENPTTEPGEVETIQPKQGIWRTYGATDGLPGAPHCLLEKGGYLWLGTNAGLCRYDGAKFVTYTAADGLVDNRVVAICEDNQGRLWIGASQTVSGGISCFDGKEFTNYTVADGLVSNQINALCFDNQGRLWIGTENGLSCLDDGGFTNYTTVDGLAHSLIRSICKDSHGILWFGTDDGLSRFDGQQFTTYTSADGLPGKEIRALCADSQGRIWIGSGYSCEGVSCFDGRQFTTYTDADGLVDIQNIVLTVYEDRQGRMWFGTWAGLSCFDGNRFTNYTSADGLWENGVFDIIEDREGQIWLAHGQMCGLSCFDEKTVTLLTDQSAGWVSTQDKKGRIWYTDRDLYVISVDSESSQVQQRKLPFSMAVIWLMVDSRDRLWIGPYQDGLYCYDSTHAAWEAAGGEALPEPRHFKISDDPVDNNAVPLLETKDGTIWFSFQHLSRLFRLDPERFTDGEPLESIDTKGGVSRMIEDSRGRLWMGSDGLSCWDGNKLTTYTREDGLPGNGITSLVEDDAGRIWIGTTHGLCCFDGEQFTHYGEERDLRDFYHWCAVKDASGQLWFAARGGIYRTDGKHFQWLTKEDGLRSDMIIGLAPQSDGSMIICTGGGVVRYRSTATIPPLVEIREVAADKVYQNPKELELTTAEAGFLIISYHGLSLVTQKMRYSYILEGYNQALENLDQNDLDLTKPDTGAEWKETWDTQVRYENLPVGEYTFKVIAINRDLVTSETPAALKLTVVPDPRDTRITVLQSQVNYLHREMSAEYQFEDIVGRSPAIKEVQARMELAINLRLDMVALITGETGTGKGLIAGVIHNNSRRSGLLLTYNCAAARDLVGSELFGHKEGAFTGAVEDRIGCFEAAEGGTLILDEIGDMPIELQANLLHVLDERKFSRIGEYITHDIDVRIIATTNQDLGKAIAEGSLREDLYHRLNGFPIHLPPLRERLDDIPLLAEHFLKKTDKQLEAFAPDVFEMLHNYPWPGNVRELASAIHQAAEYAVLEGTIIHAHNFPPQIIRGGSPMQEVLSEQLGLSESVKRLQRRLVENALRECDGNHTQAARMLKMQRSNLVRLMRKFGIK